MFKHALFPMLPGAALLLAVVSLQAAEEEEDSLGQPVEPARLKTLASERAVVAFWAENDIGWSDKYYTNGLKFAYTSPELFTDGKMPRFVEDLLKITPLATPTVTHPAAYRFHAGLAHEIYTAKDEYVANPPLDDHPYAGLLYGTFGLSSETETRLDVLELSLGVMGPSAKGKQVQNNWHHFINSRVVGGWGTQLHDEPLVQFAWTRSWRFNWMSEESLGLDFLPRLHLEAGTVRDYAALGWQWRLGWSLPQDFGVAGLRSTAGTLRPARNINYDAPLRWAPDVFYFFVDVQGEGWAWNAPLDGNAWYDSRSVDSKPFVAQAAVGFSAHWGGWRLSFSQVVRSKEFETQDHPVFAYSSVNLSVVF